MDRTERAWRASYAKQWRTNPDQLPYARTAGGTKIHHPTCRYIEQNLQVADALLDGATEDEAGGNVTHPLRVAAAAPTCKVCRGGATP